MSTLQPTQRRQKILTDLTHEDSNIIGTLSDKYGVSEMTIRRDLKALEEQGLVRRTYGGAIRLPKSSSESVVMAREKRQSLAAPQKAVMARYAVQHFVVDDDILLLGGGTTVAALIPHLADRHRLTVITNGLSTAYELQRLSAPDLTVISSGGILRRISSTFVGPLAEHCFREYHARKLFLSATGITEAAGVTDPDIHETQVKRAMIESASQVIMIMDSSKFGIKSLMTVLTLDEIDMLITDQDAPPALVDAFRRHGIDVHIAT